jgi:uncharacterized protein (TIGR02996 family)
VTEDEWLDACADEPEDDLRRFAFADWLEERGDKDRAEFIRLQIAYSRQEHKEVLLWDQAYTILANHHEAWLGLRVEAAASRFWCFNRGLAEGLDFMQSGITCKDVRTLAASPHLARVSRLNFCENRIRYRGAQALAHSPHVHRLTTISFDCNGIGDLGAAALAASSNLSHLISLDLSHNGIGDYSGPRKLDHPLSY